ncbi:hypothetical protein PLESTB_000523700 [Pleodorina starrii]|uniref:Ketopantoate reductase C-terminal domain-containing protein n=1 Tax=Pleodorina starrii TaxID=330485 RepID=A0A9W6BH07_9CHLO|nr:hypothetical protein PLESTM_000387100 [Pleodorina starrii]GLC51635.1 hypothetical protein PLESTB_000523700 [Pleodorina starrii]GLC72403.1 hypothetical protein PLESTF_001244000 [Pleodorina starrii]
MYENGVLAVADELQWELGSELGLAPTPPQQHDPRGASIDAGPGPRSSDRTDAASRNVRLYVGSVTHGCYRGAPTADEQPDAAAPSSLGPASSPSALGVVHAGLGSITIGPLAPLLAAAAAALHSAGTAAPPGGSPPPHGDVGGPGSSAPSLGTAAAAAVAEGDDAAFLHELAASVPGLAFRTATEPGGLLRELLAKLAANCAINPLTALLGCLNGALAEDPHARRLMGQVCRELTAVFGPAAFLPDSAQQGVLTGPAAAQGEELRQVGTQSFSEAGAERALLEWVLGVATATAGNRSSMLQDVVSGRPTEADYLSGWVLWVAAARGVATPVIATLHGLVKAKEGLREL